MVIILNDGMGNAIDYNGEKIHVEETNSFTFEDDNATHVFEFFSRKDREDAVDTITQAYESGDLECFIDNIAEYYTDN